MPKRRRVDADAFQRILDGRHDERGDALWSTLCTFDVSTNPLVVLDTLERDFPNNPCHPLLTDLACRAVARDADLPVPLRAMLVQIAWNGVRAALDWDLSDVQRGRVLNVICAYRMWEVRGFRLQDGVRCMLEWIIRLPLTMARIVAVLTCMETHFDNVVHLMEYKLLLISLFSSDTALSRSFLRRLAEHHPTNLHVTLAQCAYDHRTWAMFMYRLSNAMPASEFRTFASYWCERMSNLVAGDDLRLGTLRGTSTAECPITLVTFVNPMVASDGFTYEQSALMDMLVRERVDFVRES